MCTEATSCNKRRKRSERRTDRQTGRQAGRKIKYTYGAAEGRAGIEESEKYFREYEGWVEGWRS